MSDDLRAVRDFMHDRAVAPSPRLRQRVVAGAQIPAGPDHRRWRRPAYRWAVPLVAAFVALAVLAGVGLLLRPDGRHDTPGGLVRGPELDVATVLNQLEQTARGTAAVTVPVGGYLYQRTDITAAGLPASADTATTGTLELWWQAPGMISVKIRQDGKDFESRPTSAEVAEAQRQEFARSGPSARFPTTEWLAGLPPVPERLLAELQRATPAAADPPWTVCVSLFGRIDPLLPAAVRVGLLQIMRSAGGLSASEVTIAGKRRFAVRHIAANVGSEVFFDPETAHVVGDGTVDPLQAHGGTQRLWTFAVTSSLPS